MKTKLAALALVTVTALSLAPKPALAGDRELAAIGGFIGGVILGSVISDHRHDGYGYRDTTVIINDRHHDRGPSGYWKEVSVRVWVPGRWIVECDRRGRDVRRYIGGHYEYRTDRVWVSYDRHDHHDRGYSYGYGRR